VLIWLYTYKGGVKTIVWTDSFQTIFLVSSVIICTVIIINKLDLSTDILLSSLNETGFSTMFQFADFNAKNHFLKHFFGGAFIAIAMTGLDQDLMQKNLTCKNIGEAQKNMYSFTTILVIVNLLFLILGALLYIYAAQFSVPLPLNADGKIITDNVFPKLALSEFGLVAGIFFLLGIIASSFASADSALTALTTSFCIDFLPFHKYNEKQKNKAKNGVHIGFSAVFFIIILLANEFANQALIDLILKLAGYTYGPLLGLFAFGILFKYQIKDKLVPIICLASPLICFILDSNSVKWFGGYQFGFEILILNGAFTLAGLLFLSTKKQIQ
jgi:Na+/proline symporter